MACGRVLLLESDDEIRDALQGGLELCGVRCCSAGTLAGARSLLDSGCAPSLIVLDVCYPPQPCLELLASLRDEPRLAHVPLLVTSSIPLEALGSVADAAREVILKPFELDAFVASVRALVPAQPRGAKPPGPPALR